MWYIVRCGDGLFKAGDVFTLATKHRYEKVHDEQGRWWYGDPIVVDQRPIHLTVGKFRAYGRDIEQPGMGLTGGVFLEGEIDFDPKNYCFGTPEDKIKVIVDERYPDLPA